MNDSLQTPHYQKVRKFMQLAGQDTPETPTEPSVEIRELRARLILEEAFETVHALGFEIQSLKDGEYHELDFYLDIYLEPLYEFDLIETIDGCCDLSVVTMGTLIACGVPDKPFLEEVDTNNLLKIENGTVRGDGKLVKHPDHKPPRIKETLSSIMEGEA